MSLENALIDKAELGNIGGNFALSLTFRFKDGMQQFTRFDPDQKFLVSLLAVVGVDNLSQLTGKPVVVDVIDGRLDYLHNFLDPVLKVEL